MGSAAVTFRRAKPTNFTADITPKKAAKELESEVTSAMKAKERWDQELVRRTQYRLKHMSLPELIRDYENLKMRIERMENRLEYLLHINDLDLNCFRNASNHILEETFYLSQDIVERDITPASYTELRRWLELLLHISEVEYDRLVDILNVSNPWKVFYAAAYKIMVEIITRRKLNPDEESEITLRCAEKVRKHIVNAANVFIRTRDLDNIQELPVMDDIQDFLDSSWNRYILKDIKHLQPNFRKIINRK
jgi:hypothetical protein